MRPLILALLMGCAEPELLEADTADVSEMLRRDAGQSPRRVRAYTATTDAPSQCWVYVVCRSYGVPRRDPADPAMCRRCSYDACGEPMATGDLPWRVEFFTCRRR